MAAIYCDDETLFGFIEAQNWSEIFGQLPQEDQVTAKKETKIKKIWLWKERVRYRRKQKNQTVIFQSHSHIGSGKLVFEHYDKLISIWYGSANIEPLSFGISSEELDDKHQEFLVDLDDFEENNDGHVNNNQDESDSETDVDTVNISASRSKKTYVICFN